MCGICGAAASEPGPPISAERLEAMMHALSHRGPDSSGHHTGPGVALGARRLSIIDVSGGHQPLTDDTGTIVAVGNGEIYNHVELRRELESRGHRIRCRSDMAVVPHLYREHGDAFVERLRGMFAVAVWDSRRRRLLLARDRMGMKPLVVAGRGSRIAFASEIKSLLAGGLLEPRVDLEALRQVFDLGFVLQPRTMFAGVRQLAPGEILKWESGRWATSRYWTPPFPDPGEPRMSAPEPAAEMLLEALRESVRLHVRSDVPICTWLSPGLDSSIVTRLANDEVGGGLHTFTLAFERPEADETRRASTLAAYPELDLHNTIVGGPDDLGRLGRVVRHIETPLTYGTPLSRDRLATATSHDFRVVLTGEGADEILGGYDWYRIEKAIRPATWLPHAVRSVLSVLPLLPTLFPRSSRILPAPKAMGLDRYAAMVAPPERPALGDALFSRHVVRALRDSPSLSEQLETPRGFDRWERHHQLQSIEMRTRLPEYINGTLDRTTMAHAVEARLPFLDHPVVELCVRTDPRLLMRRLREKYLLRLSARGVLPREVVDRRKRGLSAPVQAWFRGPLPEHLEELLTARSLEKAGVFRSATVDHLLRAHRSRHADNGRVLLGILTTQLWSRLFSAAI